MSHKSVISYLKASSERVGRLYPILLDRHGNVIDGRHRLAADEDWPRIRLEHVETEEDRLVARLTSNVCRRDVPAGEKSEMLGKLVEIYLSEGLKPGKIAYKIAEETGMSYARAHRNREPHETKGYNFEKFYKPHAMQIKWCLI